MKIRQAALLMAASLAAYAFVIRPRMVRWGATDAEVAASYPGADLIPDSTRGSTMAMTIHAPSAIVWAWLLQLEQAHEVAALEPERFLAVHERPGLFSDSVWGFLLEPLDKSKTRLVVSGYEHLEPRWLAPLMSFALLDWMHWLVQMKQFSRLKDHVEMHPVQAHW